MKAQDLLMLNDALSFQLMYTEKKVENAHFLRDIPHFKLQYALRKNSDILEKESKIIRESMQGIKEEKKRAEYLETAPDIEVNFHLIKIDQIPEDAKIDSGAMWVLSHFLDEGEENKEKE